MDALPPSNFNGPSACHEIDVLIASAIRERQIAGAVLSVSRGDGLLLERPYGCANAYADGEPLDSPSEMSLDHVFDLASMTKVFAATLGAMLLFEDNTLDLNAPVESYLPAFSSSPSASEVRVHHLLSHTAGLPAWVPLQCLRIDRVNVPSAVAKIGLTVEPGKVRCYSDLGYMLLGCVIESVAKEPLDSFLQKRLYGPLGLHSIGFMPKKRGLAPLVASSKGNAFEQDMVARLASEGRYDVFPSFDSWRTELLVGEVNDSNAFHVFEGVSGHAGLFSDVRDLRRLCRFLLNPRRGPEVFSQHTLDAFTEPVSDPFGWGSRLGKASLEPLEKVLGPLPPRTLFAQGFTGTFALLDPATDSVVVLLTNRLQMGRTADGSYANLESLFARIAQTARDI